MNKIDDVAFAKIRETVPRARLIEDDSIELSLVVRPPSGMEWATYRAESSDPEVRYKAQKKLLALIAIQPAAPELAAYFEDMPGAVETAIIEVSLIAGVSAKASNRKL